MGALAGVRIVDLTSVVMGPYATQVLGDWGADVIKVEPPEGDVVRAIGPGRNAGMGSLFLNANRNKRSLCLDLREPRGRDAFLALIIKADVFVSNVRPQALQRLGLGPEVLEAANPRLIQVALTGFGSGGPYAGQPAYDDLIQGATGIAALGERQGQDMPRYAPLALADRVCGLYAAAAIGAALHERASSGKGQRVEVPMFETMASFVLGDHLGGQSFDPPLDEGGYQRLLSKDRRPFETADGRICAVVYNDAQWAAFLKEVGMSDLPQRDGRFDGFANRTRNIDHVYGFLAETFRTRTTQEWLTTLGPAGVPVTPMHDLKSLLDDPHLAATGFFSDVIHPSEGPMKTTAPPTRWSRTAAGISRQAPMLGEHSAEVLGEAGLDDETIQGLLDDGVVRARPSC
ncbi:CoA transferase [Caulobacter segnis]|uniref:CaiB/BaiF CoA transferase family protein n=1 Tax=Caulobacter segnis TaxID=88688 RepID=UPI00240F9D51|nr:CoA transferase [Caulobacter segnis]MDG2523012.1 CoA transferase [Caulobacter segnis]